MQKKLLFSPKDVQPHLRGGIVEGIINPAAVRLSNGKIVLIARVAESHQYKYKNKLSCPIIISSKDSKIYYEKLDKKDILHKGKNLIVLRNGTCRLPTISHFVKITLDETGLIVENIEKKPYFHGIPNES